MAQEKIDKIEQELNDFLAYLAESEPVNSEYLPKEKKVLPTGRDFKEVRFLFEYSDASSARFLDIVDWLDDCIKKFQECRGPEVKVLVALLKETSFAFLKTAARPPQ